MDWLKDFKGKFSHNYMLDGLEKEKFYGKLTINFAGGKAHTAHIEWCVRPEASAGCVGCEGNGSCRIKGT